MSQVKEKRMSVQNILIMLISNMGMDTPANIEDITDFVFEDVCETADPVEWHSGDVAIAFRRWIEAQANENVRDGATLIPVSEPKSAEDVSIGETIYKVGELRYLMEGLDDHDQICVETCDEYGDVQDLYPLALDVIDGIRLTDGTEVREVRFCQRPNSEPDTRDKQRLVDALIDVLSEDIQKGDVTVLDELLLRMPYDILKYALPEDMWADFEDSREDLIEKIMRERYGDDDPKYDGSNRAYLESLSDKELECLDSGQHLMSCDDDGFCNNCGHQ